MKIGVSGHRHRDEADWLWAREALTDIFLAHPEATGWSSLAVGADQIFAEAAMAYGRGHIAIIPGGKAYNEEFQGRDNAKYRLLLERSKRVVHVGGKSNEQAFRRAGERVVRVVDLMVLVWDGEPARGEGGVGDIADYARRQSRRTVWIDPIRREISDFVGG